MPGIAQSLDNAKRGRAKLFILDEDHRIDIGGEGRRAGIDLVVDAVSSKGFSRDKVKDGIDMLLRNGEAMEPKQGIIQLI